MADPPSSPSPTPPRSGPARALDKLGLHRDLDLVLHLPLRYEDETRLTALGALRDGLPAQVEAIVVDVRIEPRPRRQLIVQLRDAEGEGGAPDKFWPVVKEFWQELGFLVNVEIPEAGIMETDWAENRAKLPQDILRGTLGKVFDSLYSTAERDKFRTRLEKSAETGMVEIYISHRGMYEVYTNEDNPSIPSVQHR